MESPAGPSDHQLHFEKRSQRDDGAGVADVAASSSMNGTLLPPLPKARAADNILSELRNVHLTSDEDFKSLSREQLFAPVVMLPLAGDYYIDSRDIHPTLSGIKKPKGFLRSFVSDVPKVVFDIGGLFIKSHATTPDGDAYQPTYHRVVLDVNTGAIWLFYEYYQFDPDFKEEKVEFCMNETLKERVNRTFDTAKILDSIKKWRVGLNSTTVERNMRKSGAMARAYCANQTAPVPSIVKIPAAVTVQGVSTHSSHGTKSMLPKVDLRKFLPRSLTPGFANPEVAAH
ncbi:hypothetical protein V8E54_002517 [Elaphomyces granulatus]